MKVYSVAADGQCLFNSIAFGILHNIHQKHKKPTMREYKSLATSLRKICTQKMSELVDKNDRDTIQVLSASLINFNSVPNRYSNVRKAKLYIRHMKKKKTWGGYIEINMLNDYIKRFGFKGIQVLDDQKRPIREMKTVITRKHPNPIIHLMLSGVKHGGFHFNYVDVPKRNVRVSFPTKRNVSIVS